MKNGELIALLQEHDPKLPVGIGAYGSEQNISSVTLTDDERELRLNETEYRVRCKWVRIG